MAIDINWIKATKEAFGEYGILITTEVQLPDGEYIKHANHEPVYSVLEELWLDSRFSPVNKDMIDKLVVKDET